MLWISAPRTIRASRRAAVRCGHRRRSARDRPAGDRRRRHKIPACIAHRRRGRRPRTHGERKGTSSNSSGGRTQSNEGTGRDPRAHWTLRNRQRGSYRRGRLPAQFVFHAVGPIYRDGRHGEPALLIACYETCLRLAAERQLAVVSFPSISTGVYGYPIEDAAEIAVRTASSWLHNHTGSVRLVKLVQFSEKDHRVYQNHLERITPSSAIGADG